MVPKVLVVSYFPNDNIISSLLKSHGNSNLIGTLSNIQQSLTKDLGTMISGLKVYSVPWWFSSQLLVSWPIHRNGLMVSIGG